MDKRWVYTVYFTLSINYRHVSIFFTYDNSSIPYLRKNAHSHAFTEVYTPKGWMVVDSIDSFMGIDNHKQVYTAKDLNNQKNFTDINNHLLPINFHVDYRVIYGLYSRHGRFYPPFNSILDINWKQFLYYNWNF